MKDQLRQQFSLAAVVRNVQGELLRAEVNLSNAFTVATVEARALI